MIEFRRDYSEEWEREHYDFYVYKNSYWIRKLNRILSVDGIKPFSKSLCADKVDLGENPIQCRVATSRYIESIHDFKNLRYDFLLCKVELEGDRFHIFLRKPGVAKQ